MKNAYFNEYKFDKAFNLKDTNLDLAITKVKSYIEEYPNDYSAYYHYVTLLVTANRISEAITILDKIESIIEDDKKYNRYQDRVDRNKGIFCFAKLKLLFYQNKYSECYEFISKNFDLLTNNGIFLKGITLFCEKKLGIGYSYKIEKNEYLHNQIVNYSDDRFKEHLNKHLEDSKVEDGNIKSLFNRDINIFRIIEEIKKDMPSDIRIFNGLMDDLYIYKYTACGRVENKTVDYFKVITLHDSSDIITMCPCSGGEHLPHKDLDYLIEDKPKQKRLSQIEKFNLKYNRN